MDLTKYADRKLNQRRGTALYGSCTATMLFDIAPVALALVHFSGGICTISYTASIFSPPSAMPCSARSWEINHRSSIKPSGTKNKKGMEQWRQPQVSFLRARPLSSRYPKARHFQGRKHPHLHGNQPLRCNLRHVCRKLLSAFNFLET